MRLLRLIDDDDDDDDDCYWIFLGRIDLDLI